MPFSLALFLLVPLSATLIILLFTTVGRSPTRRLPPGPRPLPLIGNLHSLSSHPHRDVAELSKTFGPVLHLRLGAIPAIFISSPRIAEKVLKSHDVVFANRPRTEACEYLSYGYKGLAFSEYGSYWRGLKKICATHFFSMSRIESWEFVRREEVVRFVEGLKVAAKDRSPVDLTIKVRSMAADMICRAVIGKRCMDSVDGTKFIECIDEVMRILGSFDLNDFMPVFKLLDLRGIRKRAMTVKQPIDKFLDAVIDEHVKLREEGNRTNDFVDSMLDLMNDEGSELKLDRSGTKAIILVRAKSYSHQQLDVTDDNLLPNFQDIFEGTMDTAPVAVEWALVELLRNPEAMTKLREEITAVVGTRRVVAESDLPKLPYLAMTVKESLRMHHLGPFLLHRTRQDFVLDGYDVPKESNVLVCSWAMARDPDLWPDPEEFVPERFEHGGVDVRGQDYHLLPFGSGRRGCPAMNYSMLVVPLVLAQLVHCFDWELPNGMSPWDLDMREKFGLTMPRVVHLRATPVYRLLDK